MIKAEQIPDNVLNVAVDTYYRELAERDGLADAFQIAIAAALNAWPDAQRTQLMDDRNAIILPLGEQE